VDVLFPFSTDDLKPATMKAGKFATIKADTFKPSRTVPGVVVDAICEGLISWAGILCWTIIGGN